MTAAQNAFHMPMTGTSRLRPGEIVVDLFAGGGGASEALRQALGRDPDIAINHDADAIGMHAANHPYTRHHCEDVWHADPVAEVAGRPVGWLHASPDCTHFSQAKGGQPRDRATRSLSWVVLKWAGSLHRAGRAPRIISLENVRQILHWGPLIAKRDPATGRVLRRDGAGGWTVAARGERVPVRQQWLIPDKRHAGRTWRAFVAALSGMGYAVEWRRLVASDYGAGTTRERLFMIARRDGAPIVWPAPTHGRKSATCANRQVGLLPAVSAADCIDWSIPCRTIFDRPRPLAEKTMRRIARGVHRFVLGAAEPFIVGVGGRIGDTLERPASGPLQTITAKADAAVCAPVLVQTAYGEGQGATARRGSGAHDAAAPIGTIPAGGGSFALCAPHLVKFRGESGGVPADEPLPTITSGAGAARPAGAAHAMGLVSAHLCAMAQNVVGIDARDPLPTVLAGATRFGVTTAFLEQANGGNYTGAGSDLRNPQPTICAQGGLQRLVAAHMQPMQQHSPGAAARDPVGSILAGGTHHAVVECQLSPEAEAGALRVAAFLMRYYGEGGQHGDLREPLATITTKDRLALVTVHIRGVPYVIVDIGLRMLEPHELYRAQGFPPEYIIDRTADGRRLPKAAQVKMVGNSVSPPPLRAIAEANLDPVVNAGRIAA
jgi:DNA (cytosine-5)-methyltransferase 1